MEIKLHLLAVLLLSLTLHLLQFFRNRCECERKCEQNTHAACTAPKEHWHIDATANMTNKCCLFNDSLHKIPLAATPYLHTDSMYEHLVRASLIVFKHCIPNKLQWKRTNNKEMVSVEIWTTVCWDAVIRLIMFSFTLYEVAVAAFSNMISVRLK